jgi:hypothetical protein
VIAKPEPVGKVAGVLVTRGLDGAAVRKVAEPRPRICRMANGGFASLAATRLVMMRSSPYVYNVHIEEGQNGADMSIFVEGLMCRCASLAIGPAFGASTA